MLLGAYVELDALLGLRTGAARKARHRRASVQHGERASRQRGRGMDFAEVRAYQPGDDVRSIDWRVTARVTNHTPKFSRKKKNDQH